MKVSKSTTRAKARWTTEQKAEARATKRGAAGQRQGAGAPNRSAKRRVETAGAARYGRPEPAPYRRSAEESYGRSADRRDRGDSAAGSRRSQPSRTGRGEERRGGARASRRDAWTPGDEAPRFRRDERDTRHRRDDRTDDRRDDRTGNGRDERRERWGERERAQGRYAADPRDRGQDRDRPRREGDGRGRGYDRTRPDDRRPRYDEARRDDRGRGYERARPDDRRGRDDRRPRYDEARRDDRRDPRGRNDRDRRYDRYDRNDGDRRTDRGARDNRYDRDNGTDREQRYERRGSGAGYAGRHDARRGHRPDPHVERMRRQEPPVRATVDAAGAPGTPDPEVAGDNGFAALGLPDVLVRRLARDGITQPFPIQTATIPDALAGRDVLGRGRTGSGKTLAFGLPALTRLAAGKPAEPNRPRGLVLVPTRELAIQVSDALEPLAHVAGVRHKLVAGGLAYATQFAALDRGVDLLIATPGRLIDLVDRGAVALDQVSVAVLDEADHMADMGFLPDVTALLDMIPPGGQRLLFSATLDKGIDELVERYLSDPVEHSTDAATASVTTMAHHVLLVEPAHKKVITADVANRDGRTIVFVRTKLGADRVAREIREQGVLAAALHGGLNQGARNRVLAAFRDGRMPVLVATDVAARGIHVDEVSVVLQVDPPNDAKDYLHRAGRTARAGEAGTVVTLALPHQRRTVERLCATAGVDVRPVQVAPGDDELLAVTGARRTSGIPVPEESYLRIVEPPPRRRPQPRGGSGGRRFSRDGDSRRMKARRAG